MCGRYENIVKKAELIKAFGSINIHVSDHYLNRTYKERDIRPTNDILIVRKKDDEYILDIMKWGFLLKKHCMINSKLEEITNGKAAAYWQNLLAYNPCLFIMNRFYEWKDKIIETVTPKTGKPTTKKVKEPYQFTFANHDFFFAGGYFRREKELDENTCTIITGSGNDVTRQIHTKDRMPIILDLKTGIEFLNNPLEQKLTQCIPYPSEQTFVESCTIDV